MSENRSVRKSLAAVWQAQRVRIVDGRGGRHPDLAREVEKWGIVKLLAEDEDRCLDELKLSGAVLVPQYEAVQQAQDDQTVLQTVARADASADATSASRAQDTDFHQDGYQFQSPYLGARIGGIGFMPDIELLAFPKVVEQRFLVFADLARAARALLRAHESRMLEQLAKRAFTINHRYRQVDPSLGDAGQIAVFLRDTRGTRFHIGSSVEATDAYAGVALSLFRSYLASTAITERLESGTLYVINQRMIAHKGIRLPGIDGHTVLRRRLLRFETEE